MIKILLITFSILGFVSAAVASAKWQQQEENEE